MFRAVRIAACLITSMRPAVAPARKGTLRAAATLLSLARTGAAKALMLGAVSPLSCAQPARLLGERGYVTGVELQKTELDEPATRTGPVRAVPGSNFILPADMVLKALGQEHLVDLLADPSIKL